MCPEKGKENLAAFKVVGTSPNLTRFLSVTCQFVESDHMADELKPGSANKLLSKAMQLVPVAIGKAKAARGFPGRWKLIVSKLERVSPSLSDLSSHPFFSKNRIYKELLQSMIGALNDAVELAGRCCTEAPPCVGKLQMQSDLDGLSGKLELSLRDCSVLVKSVVLARDGAPPPVVAVAIADSCEASATVPDEVRQLLTRLKIGHAEAKHGALERLLELTRENEKSLLGLLGRSDVSAVVELLCAPSSKIREKAATIVCLLSESGSLENLLLSEGVLPPLIRLLESGSLVSREKAIMSLQRLSMSSETTRSIVGHGAVPALIELCQTGDSMCQSAATSTLKNMSAVPEVRQTLADEGIIRVMIDLLSTGATLDSKERAAECLQNLTGSNDTLRRAVLAAGGMQSLLAYIDGPLPQESAVAALRNLISSVSADALVLHDLLPRLVHVLRDGSLGARQAAASIIYSISNSSELNRLIGDYGMIPLLVKILDSKANGAREAAAQAIAGLVSYPQNARELKKDMDYSLPELVHLLNPSPQNTACRHAVACLFSVSSSKRCRKLMISNGAVGYLRKLAEMDMAGAKMLLGRLEKGKLKLLFIRR